MPRSVNVCLVTRLIIAAHFSLACYSPWAQEHGRVDLTGIAMPLQHYVPEFVLDSISDIAAWQQEKPGLHVAFGSEDDLYFRTERPQISRDIWRETGWKGERLNMQIIVWSADSLQQIRFVLHDLKKNNGGMLRKDNIDLYKVCYVLSNYPYNASNTDCGEGPRNVAYLMPDRFEKFDRLDLPGKTVRPVWLALNIPANIDAGVYDGVIEARAGEQSIALQLSITIQDQLLPPPHDWKFRLDLWQNPWVLADYYHIKPWSEEHKALLKKHLRLYAQAGGKYITTYGVHSPWGDNEYYIEGGMINWIKAKDGNWKFDYSIFDDYVQLAMSVGIDRAITIYTPLPWGERFRYLDEKTGNYIYERWLPTSDIFRQNWNAFLTDLEKHLRAKGWFDKTYLGVNENAMEQTVAAIDVIRNHSKKWKITYAGDWHKELDGLLDDYSALSGKEPGVQDIRDRESRHRTSSFYICCTPPKPNTFLFSPPVEGRWLGWYAYAHHYDGFLRWAYDSWPGDPLRDGRYIYWPAGDCFLVYPGANSSIRFEKLREGIVDYEKIRIIEEQAEKTSDNKVKGLIANLRAHLDKLNDEKEFRAQKLKEDIERGKEMVNELTDLLHPKGK